MRIQTNYITWLFVSVIACTSDSPLILQEKAERAIEGKNYTKAAEYLEKAAQLEPNNQQIHYMLGQAHRLRLFDDGSKINNVNLEFASKASEHFRKVIEISPKYEGRKFVVGPYTKLQGIWGAVGMTYLCQGKIDSAKWAFQKGRAEGGFYPALLEYNRNIMASCEQDAILFTNGDNDTYPMWYSQLVEGYRPDITVVNLSLLNVSWYVEQLKNGYPFGSNNISINLSDEELADLKAKNWNETKMELPARFDPLNPEEKVIWTLKPTFEDKILRVQDLMAFEILKANDWYRPIYFSTTVPQINKIGLDEYLAFEGLVFKLKSHKGKLSQHRLRNNTLHVYTYDGILDKHLQYVDELQELFQNYRSCFVRLAEWQRGEGEMDDARKTLEFMKKKLSEKLLPYRDEQMKIEIEELLSEVSGAI